MKLSYSETASDLIAPAVRVTWMATIGIVSAGLLKSRMMYRITAGVVGPQTRGEAMRAHLTELVVGLGIPIIQLVICKRFYLVCQVRCLHTRRLVYFLQSQRYSIYEGVGCFYSLTISWLFIVLYSMWFTVIGLISCFYCCKQAISPVASVS